MQPAQELLALREHKQELLKLKANKALDKKGSNELNQITMQIVDLEELLEKAKQAEFIQPGEKNIFVVRITPASRFDPATGKEISAPFVQKFTKPEYRQLVQNALALGYSIEVLHDPTTNQ